MGDGRFIGPDTPDLVMQLEQFLHNKPAAAYPALRDLLAKLKQYRVQALAKHPDRIRH